MYRKDDPETAPAEYVPIDDAMKLRTLLFEALPTEVQELFHHLEASRTPREWVQRQHEIAQKLADLVPYQRLSEGWKIAEPRCYCPACGAPLQRPEDNEIHPVTAHILAHGEAACPVVSEVLHWFASVIRPERFSEKSIEQAGAALARATKKKAHDDSVVSPE